MPHRPVAWFSLALTLAACGGRTDDAGPAGRAGSGGQLAGGSGGAPVSAGASGHTGGGAPGNESGSAGSTSTGGAAGGGGAGHAGSAAGGGGSAGDGGLSGSSGQSGAAGLSGSPGQSGAAGGAGEAGGSGPPPALCGADAACVSCCEHLGFGDPSDCQKEACDAYCGLPEPCPRLYPGDADPVVVACVMGALRDGTQARVSWQYQQYFYGPGESGSIQVLPGRKALVSRKVDSGAGLFPNILSTFDGPLLLQPASYFEACAQKTDLSGLLDCLHHAALGCATP